MLPAIILVRVLFAASMVFVMGYIFGNFYRNKILTTISRVAAILAIVLFIASNGILMRFGGWRHGVHNHYDHCYNLPKDSTIVR